MPAALPEAGTYPNSVVTFDVMSGIADAPLDARVIADWVDGEPLYENDPDNFSTGALSTGINVESLDDADGDASIMHIGGGRSGPFSGDVYGVPFPTDPITEGYGISSAAPEEPAPE